MPTPAIVLHQFRASHYNDKVRWALAFKGLKHERVSYLPGPHQIPIKKLSGQTSTPVLVIDGRAIAGSALSIDALETKFPEPRLFPESSAEREQALAIVDRFDREVGPATRTAAFTVFVNELGYVSRLFGGDASPLQRGIYRMMLPLVKPMMAKANGVTDPANVTKSFDTIRQTLDWIAEKTRDRLFLVGDRFSVADLTVAALMSPIVKLEHPDMRPVEPVPEALVQLLAQWKDHPAVSWVQRQYRENRPVDPN
jgi:glutathione S-transferase